MTGNQLLQLHVFSYFFFVQRKQIFLEPVPQNNWARPWENVSYAICEQQRCRSACASAQSDQCLCCSLPRQNDTSSLYIRNFKILAGLCSSEQVSLWVAWSETPEDTFSHGGAQLLFLQVPDTLTSTLEVDCVIYLKTDCFNYRYKESEGVCFSAQFKLLCSDIKINEI